MVWPYQLVQFCYFNNMFLFLMNGHILPIWNLQQNWTVVYIYIFNYTVDIWYMFVFLFPAVNAGNSWRFFTSTIPESPMVLPPASSCKVLNYRSSQCRFHLEVEWCGAEWKALLFHGLLGSKGSVCRQQNITSRWYVNSSRVAWWRTRGTCNFLWVCGFSC